MTANVTPQSCPHQQPPSRQAWFGTGARRFASLCLLLGSLWPLRFSTAAESGSLILLGLGLVLVACSFRSVRTTSAIEA